MSAFDTTGKILSQADAAAWRAGERRRGRTVALANGCFDLLHEGHVGLLEGAAREADCLIVAVNSDASVARLKGPWRPIQRLQARMRLLAALECVDAVVSFDDDTPTELIEDLSPDVLVKGGDWPARKIAGADFVQRAGGRVVRLPVIHGASTSAIVRRCLVASGANA